MQHLLSVDDMSEDFIHEIWTNALNNKDNISTSLSGKILTNLFYEASTRTSSSFYSAMTRKGGSVIPINNVKFSSATKGETLEDTIIAMSTLSDCIVLRHPDTGSANRAAKVSSVPIINGGDGEGEHPTQTLLDGFTIYSNNNKSLDNLNITFIGDLKNGRTVKSLVKLLSRYKNNNFNFISPEGLKLPSELLPSNSIESDNIESVIDKTDVLYVTRVQKERGSDHDYSLSIEKLKLLKRDSIVMHPLPRVNEIPREFDNDKRAKYFEQMRNGLWCRIALLEKIILG
ncbi:MAG: aspartate carbamoyltransferase [Pseudomonadota bacterium]|nr:aspartate carbamoyltransferase [Pseudomonadota bacterium]MEC7830208.1 aspartate carbamoyltransferase [Pseudomonadota bacterium]MEC9382725.1 aspartate carbamoyltransferase [Pseudomonadota bacterium]MEC9414421.1 aspartate carbamoyltransferase [Pseudomonadota bacterium]